MRNLDIEIDAHLLAAFPETIVASFATTGLDAAATELARGRPWTTQRR